MGRWSGIALLALLLFLLLATAASVWLTGSPTQPDGLSRIQLPETSEQHGSACGESGVRVHDQVHEVFEESQRQLMLVGEDPPEESESRGLVRVHGQVRKDGRPVADYDLVFQPIVGGLDSDREDWDFTDENGRYEVELPAACYVVRKDDEGPWLANAVVPKGKDELVLNIDLPFGW